MKTLQILFAAALCTVGAAGCGEKTPDNGRPGTGATMISASEDARSDRKVEKFFKKSPEKQWLEISDYRNDQAVVAKVAMRTTDESIAKEALPLISDSFWLKVVATNGLACGGSFDDVWIQLIKDGLNGNPNNDSGFDERMEFVAAHFDPETWEGKSSSSFSQTAEEAFGLALKALSSDDAVERVVSAMPMVAKPKMQRRYHKQLLFALRDRILNMEDHEKAAYLLARVTNAIRRSSYDYPFGDFLPSGQIDSMAEKNMLPAFLENLDHSQVVEMFRYLRSVYSRGEKKNRKGCFDAIVSYLRNGSCKENIETILGWLPEDFLYPIWFKFEDADIREAFEHLSINKNSLRYYQTTMECDSEFIEGLGEDGIFESEKIIKRGREIEDLLLKPLTTFEEKVRFGKIGNTETMEEREKNALTKVNRLIEKVNLSDPESGYDLGYAIGQLIGTYRNMQKECSESLATINAFLQVEIPENVKGSTKTRWEKARADAQPLIELYEGKKKEFKTQEDAWRKQADSLGLQ